MFRSPDVARFPFVGPSTHTVITPLWTPGLSLPPAEASEATTTNTSAADAPTSHFLPLDFAILNLPPLRSTRSQGHVPVEAAPVPSESTGRRSARSRRIPTR